MKPGILHRPPYKRKVNYIKSMYDSGEDIEIIGFYNQSDDFVFGHPPDYKSIIDKILPILKGTGISKISITLLDDNLEE